MQCINHTERAATVRCAGCAEALCPDCHIEMAGAVYCAGCKQMAVKRMPSNAVRLEPFPQGRNGMLIGLLGLVVLTPICGAAALIMGFKARGEIAENPRLCGEGAAYGAITLGGIDLFLFVINLMSKG